MIARAERNARTTRRFAEWVSFSISAALITALVVHLVLRVLEPPVEIATTSVHADLDRVQISGDRFVLPIAVHNQSRRTLRDFTVRVTYRGADGKPESLDLLIDYLGERAQQTVYAYFAEDPRRLNVRAEPLSYLVD